MEQHILEVPTLFSESLIWQLNRDYYKEMGIGAWSNGEVPHHITSNTFVGKIYGELIFAFLEDEANIDNTSETIYILELGAGHGRLAFHILEYLERKVKTSRIKLPPYCYVLSDIIEDSLDFFINHPQFQDYLNQGKLDVAYFDAVASTELDLRFSKKKIQAQTLNRPIISLANYFFDSIPSDVFQMNKGNISSCWVSLSSKNKQDTIADKINNIAASYSVKSVHSEFYKNDFLNQLLEEYRKQLFNTYLFLPNRGISCLENINQLSNKGTFLISMDKGFFELQDLEHQPLPDMVTHGSFSFWVNFNALGKYCEAKNGSSLFPIHNPSHTVLTGFLFLDNNDSYINVKNTYRKEVDNFNSLDFNEIKKSTYKLQASMNMAELMAILRLSNYDPTFLKNIFPRIRQLIPNISKKERKSILIILTKTWHNYFHINESHDLAYDIAGIFYDLGYYQKALELFDDSLNLFGNKADVFYNKALCFYQLRQDIEFINLLEQAKNIFPDYERLSDLEKLDLGV